MANIKFMLDGCDISFVAEAPEDITLKQLLAQCDRIIPHWCGCGIRSINEDDYNPEVELCITYDDIKKVSKYCNCDIKGGADNE